MIVVGLAIAQRARGPIVLTGVAAALVIGAGFNGASFLDFGRTYSSLAMALLSLGTLSCYLIVLTLYTADD